jgi:hypothetical protein
VVIPVYDGVTQLDFTACPITNGARCEPERKV